MHQLQGKGVFAIRSRDLWRTHRQRLIESGFLRPVIKGWYVPAQPDETPGDSTPWYAAYWSFCASYLSERFGKTWCLSPEQSLALQGSNRAVPAQLVVRTPRGGNKPTALPHGTALPVLVCATLCYMKESSLVGIRELRQNLSKYLERVLRGETLRVTDRGRPVAVLAPLPEGESALGRLQRAGRLVRARTDLGAIGLPPERPRTMPISDALAGQRAED